MRIETCYFRAAKYLFKHRTPPPPLPYPCADHPLSLSLSLPHPILPCLPSQLSTTSPSLPPSYLPFLLLVISLPSIAPPFSLTQSSPLRSNMSFFSPFFPLFLASFYLAFLFLFLPLLLLLKHDGRERILDFSCPLWESLQRGKVKVSPHSLLFFLMSSRMCSHLASARMALELPHR